MMTRLSTKMLIQKDCRPRPFGSPARTSKMREHQCGACHKAFDD